jgi:hypothetical protein
MNFGAAVCVVGLTATSVASVFDSAMAQQKSLRERLLGAWTLVSIVATRPDGNKEEPFSTDEGILMFDGSGYFSVQLCKRGRPKYASNNRLKGTLEEYQASAQGCYTAWGRYTVSEPDRTLTIAIDHALFPNLEGTRQVLTTRIAGDELMYSSPGAAGGTADVVWRRAQ